jgi:hypothetical protein
LDSERAVFERFRERRRRERAAATAVEWPEAADDRRRTGDDPRGARLQPSA